MLLIKFTILCIALMIMLLVFAACSNRICLAIGKAIIAFAFVIMAIGGILMLLFIFRQDTAWYQYGLIMLWVPLFLLLIVGVCGAPVLATITTIESYKNLKLWNRLRQQYKSTGTKNVDWQTGNYFDVSAQSIVMSTINLRVAKTDNGLQLAPSTAFPMASMDILEFLIFLPIFLFLALRQVFFAVLFRPIEIPWSSIGTSEHDKEQLTIKIQETSYPLKLSPKAQAEIQNHLLERES